MKDGWQTKKLGDVCAFDKAQGHHHHLPYVGLENIESNTARFIGSIEPQPMKSSTFRFSSQHVLYGRLRPYLNKVLAPDFEGHCSTEIFPIKPSTELSREYLLYWFLSDETVDRINGTCTGARMPRADMNEVLGFDFPLSPLPEQERIVSIFDVSFEGIATAKANAERNQVVEGEIEAGKRYTETDFNKIIEIKEREAHRVKLFMEQIDQTEKTLVFCATQDHALAVRDLVNQMKTSTDPDYCQRVTANDGELGNQYLRDFQDNEKTIPTILTTSQKLSTGVDARNIRNIVLMRPINTMIEFKQIIGRGTRLFDGKDYFTIYDFVKAYHHFSDLEWDGPPLEPDPCQKCGHYPCQCVKAVPQPCPVCGKTPCECPKELCEVCGQRPCVCKKKTKAKVKLADGKERAIQHMMCTTFWHPDGTPMSARQFMELLFGELPEFFKDEDELRALWSAPATRKKLLAGLAEKGFGHEQLAEMQKIINAEKSDLFDVLAYVAYALPTLTREERAGRAKVAISAHFNSKQQAFLDFVLAHYVGVGVDELDQEKLTPLLRLKYHNSIADAIADLGRPEEINMAFVGFQKYLYQRPPEGGWPLRRTA
jgi:hypothetical protein